MKIEGVPPTATIIRSIEALGGDGSWHLAVSTNGQGEYLASYCGAAGIPNARRVPGQHGIAVLDLVAASRFCRNCVTRAAEDREREQL